MKIQMRDFDYRTQPALRRLINRLRRPRPMATTKATTPEKTAHE